MTMVGSALSPIPGFADPFSSLSHLLAAAVFASLSVPLVRRGMHARESRTVSRRARVVSLGIFGASAALLLTMSGVYHLLELGGTPRVVMQRLDHAAIFILIAGTFTPIQIIMLHGVARWSILVLVWTIAILGVAFKSMFFEATPPLLGLALYLGMGWLGAVPIIILWRRHGTRFILPLLMGGVAYTVGAVVDAMEIPPLIAGVIRGHELFHVMIIAGLALHWRFVWSLAREPANSPLDHPRSSRSVARDPTGRARH